jgi:5,10-methylenetetrahydromethanopterin reductase
MRQAGPRAAVLLHCAADLDMEGWQSSPQVPPSIQESIEGYLEVARHFEPPDARYL